MKSTPPCFSDVNVERGRFMANKANKKALVRNQIITASNVYSNGLAGKMFLYVFGNEFFEVVFKTDRFMHFITWQGLLN